MRRMRWVGLIAAASLTSASPPQDRLGPRAFDFMAGTWTTVKDGLSLSSVVRPILGGTAWEEVTLSDDGNTVFQHAVMTYDPESGAWTRVAFNRNGGRSTFVGGSDALGRPALLQVSYNGRAIEPPQSRLLYHPEGDDRYVLDWQSRREDGEWQPRFLPFVHDRVDRPEPPAGDGRIAFISDRTGNREVFTMAPDGSDVRNLSNDPAGDHAPHWIAGGARLAFLSHRGDRSGAPAERGQGRRWEVDADGSDLARVPMLERLDNAEVGVFPEMHSSGSYLTGTVERDGDQEVVVWRFDGGGERLLAPAPGPDYRPRFSPDGERVLFISERSGDPELYSVGFDGSGLHRLTESPGMDRYHRWSPDGRHIAFASERDGDLEIFVMDADGSGVRQLTRNDVEDGEPSWSPDGTRIVYRSDETGGSEIHVVEVASGRSYILTQNDAYDGEPVWSPPAPR